MDMTQSDNICKRYRFPILAIGLFCIADVAVHYWNGSTVRQVTPVHIAPAPEYLPTQYPFIEEVKEPNVSLRLTRRLAHYNDVCTSSYDSIQRDMNKLSDSVMYTKYYTKQQRVVVDQSSNFAVCLQAKGGSSFWKYLFNHEMVSEDGVLSYAPNKSYGVRKIRFISLPDFRKQVNTLVKKNYTLFVFGRNPWNRLVSLYRQKVEGVNQSSPTYKYVKAACLKEPCDTFQQLLECVLNTWSKGFPDRHWEPLTAHCGLCNVPYHYIGHTETMNEETSRILDVAGVKGNMTSFLQIVRDNSIREVEQQSAHVDYKSYYKDIPKNIIGRLKDMYKHDISLLGYPDNPF